MAQGAESASGMNHPNPQTLPAGNPSRTVPKVSVIIPARDAEDTITATLDGVLSQDYAGPIEIIVIDGSESAVMANIIRQSYPSVQWLPNPAQLLVPGANAGFRQATGDIFVRCDAHTVFPPSYIRQAIATLERTGAANVGGRQEAVGTTFFGRTVALAMTIPLGVGNSRHRIGRTAGPADTAYLGVFRRETLDEIGGGYNPALIRNEDYEFNYRLRKLGKTVWFDPELIVQYQPRSTIWTLAQQYFNYGRGKSTMLRLHPASVRFRHIAAPGFVLALVAGAGLALTGIGWGGVAVLLGIYASILVAGSAIAGFRRRETAAVLLPLALAIMHLSWGIGFFVLERTKISRFLTTRTGK